MTYRQHLLTIRQELDELVNLIKLQPDLLERELILARVSRAHRSISDAIIELDATELTGYDC